MTYKLPTILFVEDEPEVRFELKRFLQRYSSDVLVAENGEEGIKLFEENTPDIVISDIKMPKMNGIDMAKKIKKLSPEQTIIFTTAHSDHNYFMEAIEMQVDGYILKPVDLNLLKKKINDISQNMEIEKQKKLYENILDDVAQMQDTMLAVYDEKESPVFFNIKLLTFLGYSSLQVFLEDYGSLSKKFEAKEGCYSPLNTNIPWLEEIKELEADQRIISMQDQNSLESKYFTVALSDKTQSNNMIVTFSEITDIVKKKHQYKHEAYTDELTQVDNRAKFNILFDAAIEKSEKTQSSLSMVLLDLDNFKQINDKYGHSIGDTVLKQFAKLIVSHIRETDSFARWGGEEFVLLLPETTLSNAEKIAKNLRMMIEKYDFGIDPKLTCSFGVTMRYDEDTNQSIFQRADKALYIAKNSGRNSVMIVGKES